MMKTTPMMRTMVWAVAAVMASVMTISVRADNCDSHANGCSVPFGLPFLYKSTFTPSCNRHDICYGCGAAYGLSKEDCDSAFLHGMTQACTSARRRRMLSRHQRNVCSSVAENLYYEAVHYFGESHFNTADNVEFYCSETWVKSCLPPSTRR